MPEKEKKDFVDYDEKIIDDEMQRSLSYELEHKTLWLWYVLNSITMWAAYFIFIGMEETVPPAMQLLVTVYYGVMLFSLSLYNIKAADKGVLNSFSRYQKGLKGGKYLIGLFNLVFPISGFVISVSGKTEGNAGEYKAYFIIVFLMAAAYEIISSYCVNKNKKVRDSEDTEEE